MEKIAFGGGCHWCTEAIFQNIKGVFQVEQGFVSSYGAAKEFSEAVIVHFDPAITGMQTLIKIHLHTHASSSNHSMRNKYRSAIYAFSKTQENEAGKILWVLRKEFKEELITEVLAFRKFKRSDESYCDYYQNGPEKPFCKRFIEPKIEFLKLNFPKNLK